MEKEFQANFENGNGFCQLNYGTINQLANNTQLLSEVSICKWLESFNCGNNSDSIYAGKGFCQLNYETKNQTLNIKHL